MTFLNLLPMSSTLLDEGCAGSCKGGCQSTCQSGCEGCKNTAQQTLPEEPIM
jgi:hypothetical protein